VLVLTIGILVGGTAARGKALDSIMMRIGHHVSRISSSFSFAPRSGAETWGSERPPGHLLMIFAIGFVIR
jgi:hypothetical protein